MDPVSQHTTTDHDNFEALLASFGVFCDFVELRLHFPYDSRYCVGASDAVEYDGIVSLSTEKSFDIDLKALALLVPDLIALGVPEKLAPLMSANNVTPEELQAVVGKRGYFPEDMPIRDYPADFVEGCLVAAWPQVLQMVLDSRDLPF